jgi:hypothetical protein
VDLLLVHSLTQKARLLIKTNARCVLSLLFCICPRILEAGLWFVEPAPYFVRWRLYDKRQVLYKHSAIKVQISVLVAKNDTSLFKYNNMLGGAREADTGSRPNTLTKGRSKFN